MNDNTPNAAPPPSGNAQNSTSLTNDSWSTILGLSCSFWLAMLNLLLAVVIGYLLLDKLHYLKDNRLFGEEKVEVVRDTVYFLGDSLPTVMISKIITPVPLSTQKEPASAKQESASTDQKPKAAPPKPKPPLNFFDVILVMLIAGALGGILCNLRGIFGYYRDEGELPRDLHVPYLTRPFTAAVCGIFIYFVASLLVTSITLTPIAEGIGFQGMISYIALAILAGFGSQEFMERLKALVITLFGERQNETMTQRLRQLNRLKEKGIIDEAEYQNLKKKVIDDGQTQATLEALNALKAVTPPEKNQ